MATNNVPRPLKVGDKVVVKDPKEFNGEWRKGVVNKVYTNTVSVAMLDAGIGSDVYHKLVGFNQWSTGVIVVRCVPDKADAHRKRMRESYKAKTAALATKRSLAKLAALKASNKTI